MAADSLFKFVFAAGALILTLAACASVAQIQGESSSVAKLDGSWRVYWGAGSELQGLSPLPSMVFNTADGSISGYDGCNTFRGRYTFQGGRLTAEVASTRKACLGETAHRISEQIHLLFSRGAEVAESTYMGARVVVMINGAAEIRMVPKDQGQ